MALKIRVLFLALATVTVQAHAQRYADTDWQLTTGGATSARYSDAVKLPSGDILWIGDREDANGNVDLWIRRVAQDGSVLWSQTYNKPGASGSLFCQDARRGPSGNIVIACNATGNATVYDTYLIKIDEDGNKLFETTLDLYDWDLAAGLDIGPSGNIVYTSSSTDPDQYQVSKLDENLNLLWTTYLGNPGQDFQDPTVPTILPGGDILLAGAVYDGVQADVRVSRLNQNGVIVYERTLGDAALRDGSPRVFCSSSGNTYLSYVRRQFEANFETRLLQLDAAGNTVWSVADTQIAALFFGELSGGDLVVNGPIWLPSGEVGQKFARITESGAILWTKEVVTEGFEHNYTRRILVGPDDLVYTIAHGTLTGVTGTAWVVDCLTEHGGLVYQWFLPHEEDEYHFPGDLIPLAGGEAIVGGETGTVTDDDAHVRKLHAEFNVFPLNTTIRLGRLSTGNLASLVENDNNYYELCRYFVPNQTTPPINVEFDSFVPADYPTNSLEFRVTSKASTTGLSQNIELWNWVTGQWDTSTIQAMNLNEQTSTAAADLATHIHPTTRLLKARLRVSVAGIVFSNNWCVQVDQASWLAKP